MFELKITPQDENRRLDKFLFMYLKNAPHSLVYKLLRKKRIKLNGKRAAGGELLQDGDGIGFYLSQETLAGLRMERETGLSKDLEIVIARSKATKQSKVCDNLGLLRRFAPRNDGAVTLRYNSNDGQDDFAINIIFEDENLLIINKPAGIPSHGGMKSKTPHLLARTLYYLRETGAYPPDATFVPALCNRLDVNTSGLVICGKNYQAIRAANALFSSSGHITKEYIAVVDGELFGSATLEGHYQKDTAVNKARITNAPHAPRAITAYKSISPSEGRTLLSINPITGRSHQIRAHMAAIGHPLAGDKKYGSKPNRSSQGYLLHCNKLILGKPILNYPIGTTWSAEPPEYFTRQVRAWFGDINI